MRRLITTSTAAVAAILATPTAAQPVEGRPFTATGQLETCDCRHGDHTIRLEAGRRYRIGASSAAFDSVVRIYRPGSSDILAEDDDSGGERNPQLYFTPSQTGDYLVRVVSFTPDGAGRYTLNVEPLEALPEPLTEATGTETMTWQIYDGSLEAGDAAEGEIRFDDYALNLETGQSALIGLDSQAFDPIVRVYSADQRGMNEIMMDDDSGGGFNAFLRFSPERGGAYIVRVTSFSTEGSGSYRLRIAR